MTDLQNAFWAACDVHSDACRACRDARRAGAPDDARAALRDARRAAMADVRSTYEALRAA